jgi:hypothetical protein
MNYHKRQKHNKQTKTSKVAAATAVARVPLAVVAAAAINHEEEIDMRRERLRIEKEKH